MLNRLWPLKGARGSRCADQRLTMFMRLDVSADYQYLEAVEAYHLMASLGYRAHGACGGGGYLAEPSYTHNLDVEADRYARLWYYQWESIGDQMVDDLVYPPLMRYPEPGKVIGYLLGVEGAAIAYNKRPSWMPSELVDSAPQWRALGRLLLAEAISRSETLEQGS